MINQIVNYEGHIFNAWECSGWNHSGEGEWYVRIGTKDEEHRNFTTRTCPITPGGLFDKIAAAKLEPVAHVTMHTLMLVPNWCFLIAISKRLFE
jgi:hypothetical protein